MSEQFVKNALLPPKYKRAGCEVLLKFSQLLTEKVLESDHSNVRQSFDKYLLIYKRLLLSAKHIFPPIQQTFKVETPTGYRKSPRGYHI